MTRAQKAKSAKVVVVSNAFEWDVKHIASYSTTDTDLASILDHFGEPTTSVVKTYTDLADRIAYDVKGGSSSKLSASTITDIHLALEASKPLHFQFNDLLGEQWRENMDEYTGENGRSRCTR
jgi:2-hydroxy-3-keto-5-methylthiopentenyl-1-phosphate phosphatase